MIKDGSTATLWKGVPIKTSKVLASGVFNKVSRYFILRSLYFYNYTSTYIDLKCELGTVTWAQNMKLQLLLDFSCPLLIKKRQKPKDPWKYKIPDSKMRTPRAVSALVDPSLFVAVHMYVPVSSGLKSWIDNVPLLTLFRPFCKAEKAESTE